MRHLWAVAALIFLSSPVFILAGVISPNTGANVDEDSVTVHLPGDVTIRFKRIPAGSFIMGSPAEERDREGVEGPEHKVTISQPFYIGIHEVTHEQWKAVNGEIRQYAGFDGSNYDVPMMTTSWQECQDFIGKLNQLGLGTFRMPTEAEWEYSARAGSTSRFYWGEDRDYTAIDEYAWFDENAEGEGHTVGEKKPNAWGLYDMAGNVWEWCSDWFAEYSRDDQVDPKGPPTGEAKVFRGGEWFNPPQNCRSAYRGKFAPNNWLYFGGLRLVMEVPNRGSGAPRNFDD
jgi:formylglycine-generating enzyme required for sulfatase activity